jgi:hypothetical protein
MIANRYEIPGFAEAVQEEQSWRDAPFLELHTAICGVKILPMTPRHLLILSGIESPVLFSASFGEYCPLKDIAVFLWVLSPEFEIGKRRKEKRFLKSCRKLDGFKAIAEISKYLEKTFFDAPGGGSGKSWGHMSWCAYLITTISSEFGWTRSEVMNCPLRILHQLRNCITQKKDPRAVIHSKKTGALISDHIALKQQRLNLINLLSKRARN